VWTQQDRDKAIWHARYKAERCPSCGTHPDDWDPDKGGDRHAYVAVQTRCAGCAALEQEQDAIASAPGERLRGVHVVLKRRDVGSEGRVG